MIAKNLDRRAQKTRQALLDAFLGLVLTRPYDEIGVAAIAARAGVGRSTLYEHFAGKHALLSTSLAFPFGTLANTVCAPDNTQQLTALLEHFRQNRALAREVFTGPMRRHSMAVLVQLIRERLRAERGATWLVPQRLAAIQLAEALLAPAVAWVLDEGGFPAKKFAYALRQSALALTTALRTDRSPGTARLRNAQR